MAVKRTVVYGLYQNSEHAERAVAEFLAAGFSKENVTTTESDNHGTNSAARTGVKGGVKIDHWGGGKVDHFLGS